MNAPTFPAELVAALRECNALICVQAVSGDGRNRCYLTTNDTAHVCTALTEYTRTAASWQSARVQVTVYVGSDRAEHTVFDVVLRRQRLTTAGALQLVWVNGPSMPTGGAS